MFKRMPKNKKNESSWTYVNGYANMMDGITQWDFMEVLYIYTS